MRIHALSDIAKENINSEIEFTALAGNAKINLTKNAKKYASITLMDSTKSYDAKMWDISGQEDVINSIKEGIIVDVVASVSEYQEKIQLTINKIIKHEENDIDYSKFIPTSTWNFEKMQKAILEFKEKIKSPHIKQLVENMVFSETHYSDFCEYPAAKSVHHNFYHGLLQHVIEVLSYCMTVAKLKRLSDLQVDRMLAIAFLHDWAKTIEYKKLPATGFTIQGSMLGHIFLGSHYALNEINKIKDFPEEDMLIIINGLLGHHGKIEYGSPVLPKSVEAQIVHEADKISGDIESILSFMEDNNDKQQGFTDKLWNMGTEYYVGRS